MGFTNNDILTLARAGFTATQISALNVVGATTPTTTPATITASDRIVQTPTHNANDTLDKILNAIQNNAINATQQPQLQTTDDILAEIINPNNND